MPTRHVSSPECLAQKTLLDPERSRATGIGDSPCTGGLKSGIRSAGVFGFNRPYPGTMLPVRAFFAFVQRLAPLPAVVPLGAARISAADTGGVGCYVRARSTGTQKRELL